MKRFAVVLLFALLLGIPGALRADTLFLKDGGILKGKVTRTDTGYRVEAKFGAVNIPADQVLKVEKDPVEEAEPPEERPGAGEERERPAAEPSVRQIVLKQGADLRAACSNRAAEARAEDALLLYRFYTLKRNRMSRTKFCDEWVEAIDWWIQRVNRNCAGRIRISRSRNLGEQAPYAERKADLAALRHLNYSTGRQELSSSERRKFLEGKEALVAAIGRSDRSHRTFHIGLFSEVKAKPVQGGTGAVPGVWMTGTNVLAVRAGAMGEGAIARKHEIGHLFGLGDQDGGVMNKYYHKKPGSKGWYGQPGKWDPDGVGWTAKIKRHLDGPDRPAKKRRPRTGLAPGPLALAGDALDLTLKFQKKLPGKKVPRRKGSLLAGAQDVADQMDAKPPGAANAARGNRGVLSLHVESSKIHIDKHMPGPEKAGLLADQRTVDRDLDPEAWRCVLSKATTDALRTDGTITIPWDAIKKNSPFRNLTLFKKPEFDIPLRVTTVKQVRFVRKERRRYVVVPDKGIIQYDRPFHVEVVFNGKLDTPRVEVSLGVDGLPIDPVTALRTEGDAATYRSPPLLLRTP
jgi:hypothetical protein